MASATALPMRRSTDGELAFFGPGEYDTSTVTGRTLVAHELAHHLQGQPGIHRQPRKAPASRSDAKAEEKEDDEKKKSRDFGRITMTFDGRDLVVLGDGTEVFRFGGQSGRPIMLDQKDADECGADYRLDSYMNDKRFVGIKNKGPIPTGRCSASASASARTDTSLVPAPG